MLEAGSLIRLALPTDYPRVISVVDQWWGGRHVADMLPKLFFVHFRETCLVAEQNETLAGFLAGLLSQAFAGEAYVHFVGVNPEFRGQGLGCRLYEKFFAVCHARGRKVVNCLTSPENKASIAFHSRLGFSLEPSETIWGRLPVQPDYDGPGIDRVLFRKEL